MKTAYGRVTEVKKIPSRSVARVVVEFDIADFKPLVAEFDDRDVFITVQTDKNSPASYGVYDLGESDENAEAPELDQETRKDDPLPYIGKNENASPARKKGANLARLAGIFCSSPEFRKFISESPILPHKNTVETEDDAANLIREVCGIESRADLDHNLVAADRFHRYFRKPFANWCEHHGIR